MKIPRVQIREMGKWRELKPKIDYYLTEDILTKMWAINIITKPRKKRKMRIEYYRTPKELEKGRGLKIKVVCS